MQQFLKVQSCKIVWGVSVCLSHDSCLYYACTQQIWTKSICSTFPQLVETSSELYTDPNLHNLLEEFPSSRPDTFETKGGGPGWWHAIPTASIYPKFPQKFHPKFFLRSQGLLQTFLELSWCQQSVTSKRDIYRWRFTSAWKNHGKTPVSCHDSGRDHSCPSPWKYLSMPVTLQWLNDTSKISKDQQGFVMFLLMEDTRVLDFY